MKTESELWRLIESAWCLLRSLTKSSKSWAKVMLSVFFLLHAFYPF